MSHFLAPPMDFVDDILTAEDYEAIGREFPGWTEIYVGGDLGRRRENGAKLARAIGEEKARQLGRLVGGERIRISWSKVFSSETIYDLATKEGQPITEIAETYRLSIWRVATIVAKQAAKHRDRQVVELHKQKIPSIEISRRLNMTRPHVRKLLRTAEVAAEI